MSPNYCGECGQRLPQSKGMICAVCHKPIKKHHRWQVVGSLVQHKLCSDPKMSKNPPQEQERLLEETQS
jgi:predicted amidophosphoribosyltransferase